MLIIIILVAAVVATYFLTKKEETPVNNSGGAVIEQPIDPIPGTGVEVPQEPKIDSVSEQPVTKKKSKKKVQ